MNQKLTQARRITDNKMICFICNTERNTGTNRYKEDGITAQK